MHHICEKGTNVTHPKRSPMTPRTSTGLFATLRALLGARGSSTPSSTPTVDATLSSTDPCDPRGSRLTRPRRRLLVLAFLAASLVLALTAASVLGAGPPSFLTQPNWENNFTARPGVEVEDVHATRATFQTSVTFNGLATNYRIEYASTEGGPGTIVGSGTCSTKNANGVGCPLEYQVHHLSPNTIYYARATAENDDGSVTETTKFKTTPISAPEVEHHTSFLGEFVSSLRIVNEDSREIGTTFLNFEARLETNGAETKYKFEYSPAEAGHEPAANSPSWTPVLGASGSITVAEDFIRAEARLIGLAPETLYYVRATVTNAEGTETEERHVTTKSIKPNAGTPFISNLTATSAHLHGNVYPGAYETDWHFEYAPAEAGHAPAGGSPAWTPVPGASGTIATAEAGEEVKPVDGGVLTGLNPATTYYVRLVAGNVNGTSTSEPKGFETAGPPLATTFAVHAIHGETMHVLGSVEPHGADTHYHFEYVSQETFEKTGWAEAANTPELDAGPGEATNAAYPILDVGQDLPGLKAGATYDFRLLAKNEAGEAPPGNAQTLTVPTPAPEEGEPPACPNEAFRSGPSARLPDCRAYEQVTPVDKQGTTELDNYGLSAVAGSLVGEDGDHLMFEGGLVKWLSGPDAGASPYFFSRDPEKGWQMTAGSPQPEAGVDRYMPQVYSPDLTQVGLEAEWDLSGASESPEIEFKVGPSGGPYLTVASVPRKQVPTSDGWVAASEDFSKLILAVEDRELVKPPTATKSGNDLYEYSAGELRQANVDSEGKTIGACGAAMVHGSEGGPNTADQASRVSSRHAVSAEGSRVFFEAVPGNNCSEPKHVYMREAAAKKTVDVGPYKFLAGDAKGSELLLEQGAGELFLYTTEGASTEHLVSPAEQAAARERLGLTGRYSYFTAAEYDGFSPGGAELGSGAPTKQVWRYDSVEKAVECISCASPFNPEPRLSANFPTGGQLEGQHGNADGMPKLTFASANGDYVFFDTPAALVPQDVDGEVMPEEGPGSEHPSDGNQNLSLSSDVYEWRRNGVDGCAHIQGCLSLISSGTGGFLVTLLGTTDSGHDVFFTTSSQLVPTDKDTALDIYDARIGGGFPPPPPRPVECEGDACSTPFAAPSDLTPSSSTFHGAGNSLGATLPEVKPKPKKKIKPKKKRNKKAKPKKQGKKPSAKHAKKAGRARHANPSGRAGK